MKKKRAFTILIIVIVIGIFVMGYLTQTVSGDYISKMLRENGVEKITITITGTVCSNEPQPTKVLSEKEMEDFFCCWKAQNQILLEQTYLTFTAGTTIRFNV